MKALLAKLWTEEDGASMIEYVLILALVVLATAGVLTSETDGLRPAVKGNFDAKTASGGPLNPASK